ncbi:MAG: thiol-activated cytolysin family protein [Niastella sp.]|nr:thiol-activated cytolysin family protein [Niastella sp.]
MKMKVIYMLAILCVSKTAFTQIKIVKKANTSVAANKKYIQKLTPVAGNFIYPSKNGNMKLRFGNNQTPVNNITQKITPVSDAMCLTKEEIKGQKIETVITIADASLAGNILPGAIISGDYLLSSGEFVYVNMGNRKPISLRTTSNLVKDPTQKANPTVGEDITGSLTDAVLNLRKPANFTGMPNSKSEDNVTVSTLEEKIGVSIGASAFYMGFSVKDNFSFSSDKYKYMYLYKFEQNCLPVIADEIVSPADVFSDNTGFNSNWFYIQEVDYGRRLYVLLESEYDLEKYSNELNGSLNWGVVSAAYSQKNTGSTFASRTNLRIISEAGQPEYVTDPSKVQSVIDNYFKKPFSQIDIAPLSFKLTNLNGKPVSIITEAFLNGNKCLDKNKVRVKIKELKCLHSDDGDGTEQVFGSISIYLYNNQKKQVATDGKTILPFALVNLPTAAIVYANENAPLILKEDVAVTEDEPSIKDKYLDLTISNLDMVIELKPGMKEDDEISDDDFKTTNSFKKSIRQMLLDGTNVFTFEFRDDKSVVHLTMEITPL